MRRTDDQFNVRMPDGMRLRIAERAATNFRSMNSEIVMILANALGDESKAVAGDSLPADPATAPNRTALPGDPINHGC